MNWIAPPLTYFIRVVWLMTRGIISAVFFVFFLTSYTVPHKHPAHSAYTVTRVVIDAGHGGHDSGCLGSKSKEKDVALAIALKLGKYIEDNFRDVKVIYTRTTDKFVELHERAAIANNAKADLFICVHCNSACVPGKKKKKEICNEDIHGTEVWVMGLKKADENLEVARRENDVVTMEKDYQRKYDGFDPNSPQANIIFSLYQNAYLDQSLRIAAYVEDEVKKDASRDGRGVKQAGFLVLYKTFMPSLLIETGFLTNKSEEEFLTSEKGQDKMAYSIFNAFKNYKVGIESVNKDKDKIAEIPKKEIKDTEAVYSKLTAPGVDNQQLNNKTDIAKQPDTVSSLNEVHEVVAVKEKAVKEAPKVKSSKSKTKEKPKPPVNVQSKIKGEVYFAVQFVTSPTPLNSSSPKLKGQTDYYTVQVGGLYKYLAGHESSLEAAITLQNSLRDKGFKDAFVVAYKDTTRITIEQAKKLIRK